MGLDPYKFDAGGTGWGGDGVDCLIRDTKEFLVAERDKSISAMQNSKDPVSWAFNGASALVGSAITAAFPNDLDQARQAAFVGANLSGIPVDYQGILNQGKGLASKIARKFSGNADDVAESVLTNSTLPSKVAETFMDGKAERVILEEPMSLNRIYGGKSGKVGRYLSTDSFTSQGVARQKLALKWDWSTMSKKTSVTLPKGTAIWQGKVGPQMLKNGQTLPGGANQIWVESDLNPSWFGNSWRFK